MLQNLKEPKYPNPHKVCMNFALTQPSAYRNGCRIYVDIITGEKLLSIQIANIELIYWSVHLSSRRQLGKGGGQGKSLYSPAACFTQKT